MTLDTVRFAIPVPSLEQRDFIAAVLEKQPQWLYVDLEAGEEVTYRRKGQIDLGHFPSHSPPVVALVTGRRTGAPWEILWEGSLPKLAMGQNVDLLSDAGVDLAARTLHARLSDLAGDDLPPVDQWSVRRLDFCHGWRFKDQLEAEHALELLNGIRFRRKAPTSYPGSIMWKTKDWCLKFYLKLPEVLKHAQPPRTADQAEHERFASTCEAARGVLRVEFTARREYLLEHYGKDRGPGIVWDDVQPEIDAESVLLDVLEDLKLLLPKDGLGSVKAALRKVYGQTKAFRLYSFLCAVSRDGMETVHRDCGPVLFCREKADLAKAGINVEAFRGLPGFQFDLTDARALPLWPSPAAEPPQVAKTA